MHDRVPDLLIDPRVPLDRNRGLLSRSIGRFELEERVSLLNFKSIKKVSRMPGGKNHKSAEHATVAKWRRDVVLLHGDSPCGLNMPILYHSGTMLRYEEMRCFADSPAVRHPCGN